MRVLYIEDNPPNVTVVARVMESLGYDLIVATNAKDGLLIAFQDHPDLILMDVGLPDMDGLTATRHLRAQEETHYIPIIAITASAMVGDRERCIEAGCDDYIAKPFQVKTLVDTLNRCLEKFGKTSQQ
jgi:two-component system, cell cycle response regulator DivK